MPPEYNNYCIHMMNNSVGNRPEVNTGGTGWGDLLERTCSDPVDMLHPAGVLFRQMFPTPGSDTGAYVTDKETGLQRKVPLWGTGYKRAQVEGNDVLWRTVDEVGEWLAMRSWLFAWYYSGHWGGDPRPGSYPGDNRVNSSGEWIRGNWWAEDNRLLQARLRSPNSFRYEADYILTVPDELGMNIMIDASGRLLKSSPYYWAHAHYGNLTIQSGRHYGVESPAGTPDMIELQNEIGLSGGALPGVRRGFITSDRWFSIPGQRLVFAAHQPWHDDLRNNVTRFFTEQNWSVTKNPDGTFNEQMHRILASRIATYSREGDYSVFNMSMILETGCKTVNDYVERYAFQ